MGISGGDDYIVCVLSKMFWLVAWIRDPYTVVNLLLSRSFLTTVFWLLDWAECLFLVLEVKLFVHSHSVVVLFKSTFTYRFAFWHLLKCIFVVFLMYFCLSWSNKVCFLVSVDWLLAWKIMLDVDVFFLV